MNGGKGPKSVVFLFLNEQWIRKRLNVEMRCFLPNAIFDVPLKEWWAALSSWFLAHAARLCPMWGLSVVLPCFPAFYVNLSQRNAMGAMLLRTKSECCTPISFHAFIEWNEKKKKGKKSCVKNRIDLNIPHIIVKMRNQGRVSCSGNIVVCVCNHLLPPVFTVKADFLEYKCTFFFFLSVKRWCQAVFHCRIIPRISWNVLFPLCFCYLPCVLLIWFLERLCLQ